MKIGSGKSAFLGMAVLFVCGSLSVGRTQEYSEGPAYGDFGIGFFNKPTGFTEDTLLGGFLPPTLSSPLPSWGQMDADVFKEVRETDMSRLAHTRSQAQPSRNPAQLMKDLDLFVRVGDPRSAQRTIRAMRHTDLARDSAQTSKIASFLIAHGEWELTQRFLEACPYAAPDNSNQFLRYGTREIPPKRMELWLDEQERLYPAQYFWREMSYRYHLSQGTLKIRRERLAAEIRTHPNDLNRVLCYLELRKSFTSSIPVDWLPSVCRFDLAIENLALGLELKDDPDVAYPFLVRALAMPITAADYRWLDARQYSLPRNRQGRMFPEAIHRYVRTVLIKCCWAAGQWEDAQAQEKELAAQASQEVYWAAGRSYPGGPWGGFGGGFSGGFSQPAAAPTSESDYNYWLVRANASFDRKERDQADLAFQKALALTDAHPGDKSQDRIRVMWSYTLFLNNMMPTLAPLANWVRLELEKEPPDGEYAPALVDRVMEVAHNSPERDLLAEPFWSYLTRRKTWQKQQESVLFFLRPFTRTGTDDRFWARATLATGHSPEKERALGALLAYTGEERLALPLLQDVARQTQSAADRQAAARIGLNLALSDKDWPQAKAFWGEARHGLLESNSVRYHQALLELALQHQAREEAFDLFADWMRDEYNIFRGLDTGTSYYGKWKVSYIQDLLDLGLRERLQLLFQAMAVAYPTSHAPQDGLLTLQLPPSPPSNGEYREPVPFSLRLTNQDLVSALRRVCEQEHTNYIFRLDGWTASKVTLDLRKVTRNQAIQRILTAASPSSPLEVSWPEGVLVIRRPFTFSENGVARSSSLQPRLDFHVTARLKGMGLDSALSVLRSSLGISYSNSQTYQPEQWHVPIAIDLTDVPVHTLLERLLKQNPYPSTYWFQEDVLRIGLQDEAPD